jgi:hypothetical protein
MNRLKIAVNCKFGGRLPGRWRTQSPQVPDRSSFPAADVPPHQGLLRCGPGPTHTPWARSRLVPGSVQSRSQVRVASITLNGECVGIARSRRARRPHGIVRASAFAPTEAVILPMERTLRAIDGTACPHFRHFNRLRTLRFLSLDPLRQLRDDGLVNICRAVSGCRGRQ